MKRLFVLLLPLLYTVNSDAEEIGRSFIFKGVVLGSDSIPVENAYFVNYRNVRAYSTNSEGKFKIPVHEGDSLKLIHLSYKPIIIKVLENDTTIIMHFNENLIETVDVKAYDVELEKFNKNMKIMKIQIDQMSHYNYRNTKVQNPYNSDQFTGTTGISISDIIDLFKRKK